MNRDLRYGPTERLVLWTLAAVGFVGVNGAFLYGLIAVPGAYAEAMSNPIAVAFMAEAFLLVALLAYLLTRWGVARLGWGWFVGLSLLGSILFALPVVLLWAGRGGTREERGDGPNMSVR